MAHNVGMLVALLEIRWKGWWSNSNRNPPETNSILAVSNSSWWILSNPGGEGIDAGRSIHGEKTPMW